MKATAALLVVCCGCAASTEAPVDAETGGDADASVDGGVDGSLPDCEIELQIPNGMADASAHVAPAADGGLFVAGSFAGSLTLFGETHEATTSGVYLFALDAAGELRWLRVFSSDGSVLADDIAAMGGDAWVVGRLDGSVDFGSGAVGGTGVFLLRASPVGTTEVELFALPTVEASPSLVSVAPSGDVYFTGAYRGSASLAGIALPLRTDCSVATFLARHVPEEGLAWADQALFSARSLDAVSGRVLVVGDESCAATDTRELLIFGPEGDRLLQRRHVGAWSGALLEDGRILIGTGSPGPALTALDAAGEELWRLPLAMGSTVIPRVLVTSATGAIAVGGGYRGTLMFGPTEVARNDGAQIDAFVLETNMESELRGSSTVEGPGLDETRSLAFDAAGNMIVGGARSESESAFVLRRCFRGGI